MFPYLLLQAEMSIQNLVMTKMPKTIKPFFFGHIPIPISNSSLHGSRGVV
ncbi:MAG: hypothetical protein ACFWUG_00675 [Rahnella inusitata]